MILEVTVFAIVATVIIIIFMKYPRTVPEGFCSIDKSDAVLSPVKVMSTDVYSLSTPDHVILI